MRLLVTGARGMLGRDDRPPWRAGSEAPFRAPWPWPRPRASPTPPRSPPRSAARRGPTRRQLRGLDGRRRRRGRRGHRHKTSRRGRGQRRHAGGRYRGALQIHVSTSDYLVSTARLRHVIEHIRSRAARSAPTGARDASPADRGDRGAPRGGDRPLLTGCSASTGLTSSTPCRVGAERDDHGRGRPGRLPDLLRASRAPRSSRSPRVTDRRVSPAVALLVARTRRRDIHRGRDQGLRAPEEHRRKLAVPRPGPPSPRWGLFDPRRASRLPPSWARDSAPLPRGGRVEATA